MIMAFVFFHRQVAVLFVELYGRGNSRYEDPYAVDRDALLLIHPYRARYGLREAQTLDGILDFLPYRLVDDLVDILFAEVGQRLAYDIFYLVVALYRTVERILVQRGACAVARDDDRPAVVAGYYAAAFAQPLFRGFRHVVRRRVRYEQLVGYGPDILGKGRPRLVERGFYILAAAVVLLLGCILRPAVVLVTADAGYRYGVDAVVGVVSVRSFSESSSCKPHIFLNAAVVAPLTVYMRSNTLLR